MRMPSSHKWVCPVCAESIPVPIRTQTKGRIVTVNFGKTDLADAAAHLWTHSDAATEGDA